MNPIKVILTLIPFTWSILCIPFVNKVKPLIFGLPFLAAWMIAGILIACACIATLYSMHRKEEEQAQKK